MKNVHQAIDRYYTEKLGAFGTTPRGVDWKDSAGQRRRFELLLKDAHEAAHGKPWHVTDLGCGYGELLTWIHQELPEASRPAHYLGLDLSRSMIEAAIRLHGERPEARFAILAGAQAPLPPCDLTVASGIFNTRMDFTESEWTDYIDATIDAMARASTLGFAFNMLSAYADEHKKRGDLHYAEPLGIIDRCIERYSKDVRFYHHYGMYEFTIQVWF